MIGNSQTKKESSVFVAPLDYLIKNGLMRIEAHVPNYDKDFPLVKEELVVYDKIDELFKIIQDIQVKNVFDSNIDGKRIVTRVISVGDENTKEIISDIYNKNYYRITKNGEDYCQLEKNIDGDYNVTNMSKLFQSEYMANIGILTNLKTGEKQMITLDNLIKSKKENFIGYELKTFTIQPTIIKNFNKKSPISYLKTNKKEKNKIGYLDHSFDNKKDYMLIETIKPRVFKNFTLTNKKENKRINYLEGYYIGFVLNNKRHGKGKLVYYKNGDYKDGIWNNDNFIKGKVHITYLNGGIYIGEYSNGDYNGKGKYVFINGNYQEGTFSCGEVINGEETYNNGYYIGEFRNGERDGEGKFFYNNGDYYEGGWSNGEKNGYGEELVNGITFKGNYIDGERHGEFERISRNGSFDYIEYEYGVKKTKCIIF